MTAVLPETIVTSPVAVSFMATTSRDLLDASIKLVSAGLSKRPSLAILACVLIEADADGVTLAGFDYEIATRQRIAGSGSGRVLVNAALLKDMVAKLAKNSDVTLALLDNRLELRCGTRTYKLPLFDLDDYPALPEVGDAIAIIDAADLARLPKVTIAAGKEDTLPALTTVSFEFDAAKAMLTTAATDRYRLAMLEMSTLTEFTGQVLVAAKTVDFVVKQLAKYGDVSVSVTGEHDNQLMSFSAGGRSIITRTITAEFPKYRLIFPSESSGGLLVAAKALVTAIDGVSVAVTRNVSIRIALDITGATAHAGSVHDAEASEFFGGAFEGEPLTIGFNPSYLADGVKACGSADLHIAFNTPNKPVVITDPTDSAFSYLLMPVRQSH
jgi:DNA polymerase-3 subunit beta